MGISNFPSPAEVGLLPLILINTVMSVALVKNKLRSILLQFFGGGAACRESEDEGSRARRVSVTRYGSLGGGGGGVVECCVCLCGFEDEEEVSELSCKHFFHKACLDKWFHNYQRVTCPLCRSIL